MNAIRVMCTILTGHARKCNKPIILDRYRSFVLKVVTIRGDAAERWSRRRSQRCRRRAFEG